jgi:sulfoquinovosyltransferase
MPSDTETLGFVVLEAMASGVPSIGVNAGGLVDIINSDSNGYLVSNDDNMVEFTAKTKKLIENTDLRLTLGHNARKYAESLSWEAATLKLRNEQYPRAIAIRKARREERKRIDEEGLKKQYNSYRPDLA